MRVGKHLPSRKWWSSPYFLWLLWLVWLYFLISPLVELFQLHLPMPRLLFSLAGIMVFVGTYLWGTWDTVQHHLLATSSTTREMNVLAWLPLLLLSVLSCGLTLLLGPTWNGLFIFTCAYVSSRFPFIPVARTTVVLLCLSVAVGLLVGERWRDLVGLILLMIVVSFTVIMQTQWIKTRQQLEAAREEIAHLATLEERLRIARDLHDLLGHNLSLITLKSELAGHLLEANAERSTLAPEIRDIEQVARTTLQEVREVVAGYRTPSLLKELREAEATLASAHITYRFDGHMSIVERLPARIAVVLAWAVREGTTNVIRHSQARWCHIHIQRKHQEIHLEILNSGPGRSETNASHTAFIIENRSGLHGLSERVAAVGGTWEAKPCPDGGFRLTVAIPMPLEKAEETHLDMMATLEKEREKS